MGKPEWFTFNTTVFSYLSPCYKHRFEFETVTITIMFIPRSHTLINNSVLPEEGDFCSDCGISKGGTLLELDKFSMYLPW